MEFVWGRYSGLFYTGAGAVLFIGVGILSGRFWFVLATGFLFLFLVGLTDYLQKKRAVLGNFPLMGRFRFIFEAIRPELRQYFWEADSDELPYSRNQRSMVYQRSKEILAARPFGSDENQYLEDFNWLNHSICPSKIEDDNFRIRVGEGRNAYDISVLNISGTSFGSISPKAIQSFSLGAKKEVLLITPVKVLYLNITSKVGVIRYGKFPLVILAVEQRMVNLMKTSLLKKLNCPK